MRHPRRLRHNSFHVSRDKVQGMVYVTCVNLLTKRMQWRIQDFPEEGAPTPRGAPTYNFANFPQKLHEIEKFEPGGGGASVPRVPQWSVLFK